MVNSFKENEENVEALYLNNLKGITAGKSTFLFEAQDGAPIAEVASSHRSEKEESNICMTEGDCLTTSQSLFSQDCSVKPKVTSNKKRANPKPKASILRHLSLNLLESKADISEVKTLELPYAQKISGSTSSTNCSPYTCFQVEVDSGFGQEVNSKTVPIGESDLQSTHIFVRKDAKHHTMNVIEDMELPAIDVEASVHHINQEENPLAVKPVETNKEEDIDKVPFYPSKPAEKLFEIFRSTLDKKNTSQIKRYGNYKCLNNPVSILLKYTLDHY